jgi:ankyrin repeat protein
MCKVKSIEGIILFLLVLICQSWGQNVYDPSNILSRIDVVNDCNVSYSGNLVSKESSQNTEFIINYDRESNLWCIQSKNLNIANSIIFKTKNDINFIEYSDKNLSNFAIYSNMENVKLSNFLFSDEIFGYNFSKHYVVISDNNGKPDIKEMTLGQRTVLVIEAEIKKGETTRPQRIRLTVDSISFNLLKVEYFTEKGILIKTIIYPIVNNKDVYTKRIISIDNLNRNSRVDIEITGNRDSEHIDINEVLNTGIQNNLKVEEKLILFIQIGDMQKVDDLLENGLDINYTTKNGSSILEIAIEKSDVKLVKKLITKGANVNFKDSKGYTALHKSILLEKDDITDLLLINGFNVTGEVGKSIAVEAIKKKNFHAIEKLIRYGLNINEIVNSDLVIINIIVNQDPECIDYLVEKGSDLNIQYDNFYKLLLLTNNSDFIKHIYSKYINVNKMTKSKSTILLDAVLLRSPINIVKLLIDLGADPNIKVINGNTIYDIAKKIGDPQIVSLLNKKN